MAILATNSGQPVRKILGEYMIDFNLNFKNGTEYVGQFNNN